MEGSYLESSAGFNQHILDMKPYQTRTCFPYSLVPDTINNMIKFIDADDTATGFLKPHIGITSVKNLSEMLGFLYSLPWKSLQVYY